MDKKVIYGIGIGLAAVALYMYFNKKKVVSEPKRLGDEIPAGGINNLGFKEGQSERDLQKEEECRQKFLSQKMNYPFMNETMLAQFEDDFMRSCIWDIKYDISLQKEI